MLKIFIDDSLLESFNEFKGRGIKRKLNTPDEVNKTVMSGLTTERDSYGIGKI